MQYRKKKRNVNQETVMSITKNKDKKEEIINKKTVNTNEDGKAISVLLTLS